MVSRWLGVPVCICGIAVGSLTAQVRIEMRTGRPVVNGVFVNGHGPYRFLLDTGSNVSFIEKRVADAIGLVPTIRVAVESSTGRTWLFANEGNEIALGQAKVGGQELLISALKEIRDTLPEAQGILGQGFLAKFDYLLDVRGQRLEFGKREVKGRRSPWRMLNGRMAVLTNLGELVLDSGARELVRFGVLPDRSGMNYAQTATGGRFVGSVVSSLAIDGRNIWIGEAVAIPDPDESGVAGLMPLGLFKAVYVSNSERYVVLE